MPQTSISSAVRPKAFFLRQGAFERRLFRLSDRICPKVRSRLPLHSFQQPLRVLIRAGSTSHVANHGMPEAGSVCRMADLPIRKPAGFEASGKKLLLKTAELIQRAGGHALAMYADSQHNCLFYASSALQALAVDIGAAKFFCQQLVLQLHPGQVILPRFKAAVQSQSALAYQSDRKSSRKTWKDRVPTHAGASSIDV